MGFFTKPVTPREVLIFIEAVKQANWTVADPIGERMYKTKAKSAVEVADAVVTLANILIEKGQLPRDDWSAERFAHVGKDDNEAVRRAKVELIDAFFNSAEPELTGSAMLDAQAERGDLTKVDWIDNILNLCWAAADFLREYDINFGVTLRAT